MKDCGKSYEALDEDGSCRQYLEDYPERKHKERSLFEIAQLTGNLSAGFIEST